MTYDEQLSFKQNSDSGEDDDASIQPHTGEPATPDASNRPLQHLRRRTERVRAIVESLLYFADYDRATVLRSNARFALAVDSDNYTLSMVSGTEDDIWSYPALTPGRLSGGRAKGGKVYVGDLPYSGELLTNDLAFTAHSDYTGQRGYADGSTFDGGGGNPAITLGANGIRLTLAANPAAAGGTIVATITGSPKRRITITYGTLTTSTTIDQIIAFVNNPASMFTGQTYGPAAFFRASRDPATPGTAAPTAFTDAGVRGAYDSEAHQVTAAQLAAFFAISDNRLKEGEAIALSYPQGPVESGGPVPRGGKRQSLWDLPTDRVGTKEQNTSPSSGYLLFNTGREPEKIPGSVPIGKLIGGEFVFVDGTRVSTSTAVRLGESRTVWDALAAMTSPTGASLLGYGGGPAYNGDASGSTSPQLGAGTLEATLDQLLADIANESASQSGARRLGCEGLTSTASTGNTRALSVIAGSLRELLEEILGVTNPNGVTFRMHESGHAMRGADPLRKRFFSAGQPTSGAEFLRAELHYPANLLATSPTGVNETAYQSLQALFYDAGVDDNLIAEVGAFASATTLTLTSMSLTRFTNVFARLPLVQDAFTTNPVPVVWVELFGLTGAASAPDGYYYITARNTGTGVITLKKANGDDPNFTGMVGSATVTFHTSIRDANDRRFTRKFWHHFGAPEASFTSTGNPAEIVAVNSIDTKLKAVYTPSGNAGALQRVEWANRVVYASTRRTAGGSTTRATENTLITPDKQCLDGQETGHAVSAILSHHHAGDYTRMYSLAHADINDLLENEETHGWTLNVKEEVIFTAAASAFPNHDLTHALLNIELVVTAPAAIAGTNVRYVVAFYKQAADTNPYASVEIFTTFHANPGVLTIHRAKAQITIPVIHEAPLLTGQFHFYVAVTDRNALSGGSGSEVLTVTQVGGQLIRVDT